MKDNEGVCQHTLIVEVCCGQMKGTSTSSVPKSTSSMTLPVSTPSSHSHLDELAPGLQATAPLTEPHPTHPPHTPLHVERRLDELARSEREGGTDGGRTKRVKGRGRVIGLD